MANEDVLERARNFDRELSEADKQRRMVDLGALHLIHALAAALREELERFSTWEKRATRSMTAASEAAGVDCCDMVPDAIAELRARNAELVTAIGQMQEGILRVGCECEPQIGFRCGPCRFVEIGDVAVATARGEK